MSIRKPAVLATSPTVTLVEGQTKRTLKLDPALPFPQREWGKEHTAAETAAILGTKESGSSTPALSSVVLAARVRILSRSWTPTSSPDGPKLSGRSHFAFSTTSAATTAISTGGFDFNGLRMKVQSVPDVLLNKLSSVTLDTWYLVDASKDANFPVRTADGKSSYVALPATSTYSLPDVLEVAAPEAIDDLAQFAFGEYRIAACLLGGTPRDGMTAGDFVVSRGEQWPYFGIVPNLYATTSAGEPKWGQDNLNTLPRPDIDEELRPVFGTYYRKPTQLAQTIVDQASEARATASIPLGSCVRPIAAPAPVI